MHPNNKKKPVKIAQVGLGYWGPNITRNLASNPNIELYALCDANPDALEKMSRHYPGTILTTSLAEVFDNEEVEAVVITTPSSLHYEHAHLALEAGKHVFVEKPMTTTVQEGIALTRYAHSVHKLLMVGHTYLYNNIVQDIKKRVENAELGDIHYAYSQRLNLGQFRRDIDVLWTLAPHDISILNYWFDSLPIRVSAHGLTHVLKEQQIADVCFGLLEYSNGYRAHLHLSWLDPQKTRKMVLVGSKKMLIYDDVDAAQAIQIFDKRVEKNYYRQTQDFAEFTTVLRAGDLIIPNIRLMEPLSVEMNHFATSIQDNTQPITNGEHGLEVVAILEALSQSMAQNGQTIEIQYPQLT